MRHAGRAGLRSLTGVELTPPGGAGSRIGLCWGSKLTRENVDKDEDSAFRGLANGFWALTGEGLADCGWSETVVAIVKPKPADASARRSLQAHPDLCSV